MGAAVRERRARRWRRRALGPRLALTEGKALLADHDPRTQRVVEAHQLESAGEPVTPANIRHGIAVDLQID